ncbi:MAG: hypothetical protein JWR42_2603 [Marmoricola sp.]|nr:hypothetical protein [Marmoricola sp.]
MLDLVDAWRVRGRAAALEESAAVTYQLLSILQPARTVATDPTSATDPAGA